MSEPFHKSTSITKRMTQAVSLVSDDAKAICFDAFGTLVEIAVKRNAIRTLYRALTLEKRNEFKARLMREDRELKDWPEALGTKVPAFVLEAAQQAVTQEAASVVMRSGMTEVWHEIQSEGLKTAICSNLATPFGSGVRLALPSPAHATVFSYEIGGIKPEPAIYECVTDQLGLPASKVLFVGDTRRTDIDGPRAFGFAVMHVSDFQALLGSSAGKYEILR